MENIVARPPAPAPRPVLRKCSAGRCAVCGYELRVTRPGRRDFCTDCVRLYGVAQLRKIGFRDAMISRKPAGVAHTPVQI